MSTNGLFSWFSSKESTAPEATWDATTATVQNQPTSPQAPSTDRVVTEQSVRDIPSTTGNWA